MPGPRDHAARSRAISSSTVSRVDPAARRQRRHAHHRGVEVAEVARPERLAATWRRRGSAARASRLKVAFTLPRTRAASRARTPGSARCPRGARPAPGSRNVHRLMRASRSSRNCPFATRAARSRLVPAMSWKSLLHLAIRAHRQERLLLDRAQQHRLLVEAQLADLVEEEHAAVRLAQQAGAIVHRAGEGAARRGRRARDIAPSPRSVAQFTSTNSPSTCRRALLELVDPPRQLRLAGAGRPREQERRARRDRDALDLLDHAR